LLRAVRGADRLVLLGDIVELRQRPVPQVLGVAREPLQEIGNALGADKPIVLLAGNHDHGLLAPGLAVRDPGDPLGTDTVHAPAAGGALAAVTGWLGAERTEVRYPGVWLREDVWATHGHYGDRHTTIPMLERLGAGVTARVAGEPATGPARAEDYEAALAPMYAWLDALAASASGGARPGGGTSARAWRALAAPGRRGVRGWALAAGFPVLVAALNRAGIGPLSARLDGSQLRRGALRAMSEVAQRLGVGAGHIVFGHTHRAGPLLPTDDIDEWRTLTGARLTNTGAWVRDRMVGSSDPARSPYRAGFAVWVHDTPGTAPELVNLLD
jgi:hypothetical protein